MEDPTPKSQAFTAYEKFIVAILTFLQFTIVLDFMVLSPLGAVLMPALKITPAQFGIVVSVYAFSAGISGFLAAGFADRFDRRNLLLFFYTGFVIGTLLCGLANTFEFLVFARTVTGLFGGVIGSIVAAIITDVFPIERRGRVMGFIQTAFSASQVLGLPAGLYFSGLWGWQAPFLLIVAVSVVVGIAIAIFMRPINEHLKLQTESSPVKHLISTVTQPKYAAAFLTTALLTIGGFMMMPFTSSYIVHNLGIDMDHLPMIYMITGICSIVMGPLVGRACDAFGSLRMFVFGTIMTAIMVTIYVNLGTSPLLLVASVNVLMFVGIYSRMIPSQTLISTVPAPASRGAFMAVSSSLQQMAGGFASVLAGLIVIEDSSGLIRHFDILGYVVIGTSFFTLFLMWMLFGSSPNISRGTPAEGLSLHGH